MNCHAIYVKEGVVALYCVVVAVGLVVIGGMRGCMPASVVPHRFEGKDVFGGWCQSCSIPT